MAMPDRFRLDGQVVLLTGAGRGLGRAMALSYADAGAKIAGASRTLSQLEETAELVAERGGEAISIATDVTDPAAVEAMVSETIDRFGRVDILMNNAGGGAEGDGSPLEQLTDEQWRWGIDMNLTSQMLCARAVLPHMTERGSGVIINVASGFGLRGGRDNWMYVSAKAGVVNLTRSLAVTYGPAGVRTQLHRAGHLPAYTAGTRTLARRSLHPDRTRRTGVGNGTAGRLPLLRCGSRESAARRSRRMAADWR